ncbi:hypothetical protein [Deinococcus radiotolerans]|uniref:Gp5/Type VI secretion system Vgr protein OB-fold domain-containing protein n=1 Tax=Deinococcus radiotolerans TaxID=1309407 RepID=A0ABQ2FQ59_9DEIO|nr:hypothetical protein [Deinococcus radiotolerans]GGL15949.1 hypothetical protein GCM10010844_38550 [Deinococcus radiotolerans]
MAVISAAGVPCGAPSSFTLPLTGRPWADLTLAQPGAPFAVGDRVQVAVQDGPTFTLTVERIGPRGGFARVRLVGGTGGLSQDIEARYYRAIPAATVVREILADCGETPGDINLPGTLAAWVRAAGPAHEALRALMMRFPERVWRMDPDGRVHVEAPGWPDAPGAVAVETEDAAAGTFTVAFTPGLLPGMRVTLARGDELLAKRVTRVTHALDEVYGYPRPQVQQRTVIGTGDGQDQGVTGLEQAVQRAVRWVDYLALYEAEVIRDHGNHELDLRPMHPLLPEMTRVRLVQPLPGARVKLKAGGVVVLSFQAGDPSRPVALHYGACELELLEVSTGRGQVIRVDDDRGQVSPEDKLYQRPHVRVQDAAGQIVELWAQPGKERITVRDKAGQQLELNAAPGQERVTLRDQAGQLLDLNPVTGTVNVTAITTVNVTATSVNLGGPGGSPVARVGDSVNLQTGQIVSGSPTVRAT